MDAPDDIAAESKLFGTPLWYRIWWQGVWVGSGGATVFWILVLLIVLMIGCAR